MAIKTDKAIKISQKHLLGIQDLSINDVNLILDEAHTFIKVNQSKNKKTDVLRGKTQINLFFEPSTSCLLYTSPSPRDGLLSRMPSSA